MRPLALRLVCGALLACAASGVAFAQQALTPPQLVAFVPAEYPRDAARQGLEAAVVLRIDIDATGSVTDVLVVEPAGNGFDEAAVAACRQFQFQPARRGEQAIAARISYRYRFTLSTPPPPPPPSGPAPTTGTLRGWVLDRLGEPVVDAVVSLRVDTPSGAAGQAGRARTDDAGGFVFGDLPAGGYSVDVAAAGYRILETREQLVAGADLRVRYRLREEGGRYESVTRARVVAERDLVRRTLTPDDMRRVPGTSGDALAAVQALPGVARPPLGLGLFIIRGSPPDDTLVLLEEHPVPLPYHLGGLATVVTSDLIESIELLPGSFSVRHGRAAGGVVDIQLRTPRRDRLHAYADVDLVDAGILAEAPLGDRAGVAVAVRRSYIDAVMPLFFPDDIDLSFTQFPVYWDYQLLGDLDLARDHGLRLIVSGSDDVLGLDLADGATSDPAIRGAFETHFAYHQVTAQLESRLSHGVVHRFSPAFTWSRTAGDAGPNIHFDFASSLVTVRQELDVPVTSVARVRMGLDAQGGPLDTEVRAPQPPDNREASTPVFGQPIQSYDDGRFLLNFAAFAELALSPGGGVELVAGARVDRFGLIDAVTIDPRASIRWRATSRLVWKAGLGVYSQPPRGYEVVPGFGNPDLEPERGVHYAVGFERKLAEALTLDVELFAKTLSRAAAPDPDSGFASTGRGRATGLETMLVLRPRLPAFGWISYTLSRSERRDRPGASYRLFEYDQTHIFSLVAGVLLPGGLEAGLRARYTSGYPETPVDGAVYDADFDVFRPVSDPTQSSRIPPYFALDLRVARRWRGWGARWTLTAEVQNATVHENPERRVYQYDYRGSAFTTGIPILPNLGLRAEM